MKIIVAVTLYNSSNIIERTLGSIISQSYKNFVCYITDDLSTDNSAQLVENFIEGDDRFIIIRNKEKRYQGGNYDLICRDTPGVADEDIVVEVDGDDWLPDANVFKRVIDHYNSGDIWIANGSFRYASGKMGFSKPVTDLTKIRKGPYTASHLRTWKVFLWRAIKPQDLRDQNGNWWSVSCDLIFMYDMFELAGLSHYKFMSEINYVYNEENPYNEHKLFMPKINKMVQYSSNKKPRSRLIREKV